VAQEAAALRNIQATPESTVTGRNPSTRLRQSGASSCRLSRTMRTHRRIDG
jgi:hypothetical protein